MEYTIHPIKLFLYVFVSIQVFLSALLIVFP